MFDLDYISELVQKLLLAILPILAAQGAAYLFAAYKAKRAELSRQQKWLLDFGIETAIKAAEQLYASGDGKAKKAYALDVAEKWIAKHGLSVDLDVLDAQIEAAVFDQFSKPLSLPEG